MAGLGRSQALRSRLFDMRHRAVGAVVDVLAEEAGAEADGPLPALVASQLGWIHGHVVEFIQHELVAGRTAAEASRAALGVLDEIETLLGDRLLGYARRPAV